MQILKNVNDEKFAGCDTLSTKLLKNLDTTATKKRTSMCLKIFWGGGV